MIFILIFFASIFLCKSYTSGINETTENSTEYYHSSSLDDYLEPRSGANDELVTTPSSIYKETKPTNIYVIKNISVLFYPVEYVKYYFFNFVCKKDSI